MRPGLVMIGVGLGLIVWSTTMFVTGIYCYNRGNTIGVFMKVNLYFPKCEVIQKPGAAFR